MCLEVASKDLCELETATCHYSTVYARHGHGTAANLAGVWGLALDRCLAFDMSRRGLMRSLDSKEATTFRAPTPQRMGWLQGLAGPTAANLWPSTYFSFWKLARNVWCGDRDLGRRGQPKIRACYGTVSPRTELMQLDGAVLSLQASHASAPVSARLLIA
ncbi:uncharacterized protein TrAtP1_008325 [Trichoderma atroviride]|uniref:uncharacterized protein n=1 Tax=Hypocrea atroviridis TaxID=63577 RepID=UPI00331FE34E|nr:hypothetical protein TrAtP1_008325 [Trichoderma atroviride]